MGTIAVPISRAAKTGFSKGIDVDPLAQNLPRLRSRAQPFWDAVFQSSCSCFGDSVSGIDFFLAFACQQGRIQTGISASISQPSLSSSSALFEASSEATSMRRNLSPWLQYSLVNPITAGAPGCRQRHVDPAALINQ